MTVFVTSISWVHILPGTDIWLGVSKAGGEEIEREKRLETKMVPVPDSRYDGRFSDGLHRHGKAAGIKARQRNNGCSAGQCAGGLVDFGEYPSENPYAL